MDLNTPIQALPNIGPETAKLLRKLGIITISDVLFYFPFRYLDYSKTMSIRDISEGETVTIKGTLKTIQSRRTFRGRLSLAEGIVSDQTGSIKIIWFNQSYLAKTLSPGDEILLSGTAVRHKSLQLVNPVYEKMTTDHIHTGRLVPVYRVTDSLSNRKLRNLVHRSMPSSNLIADTLPSSLGVSLKLMPLADAIKALHFPDTMEQVERARFRLAFEDIFPQQLAIQLYRKERSGQKSHRIEPDIPQVKQFLATLPFTLTASQKRAAWDIFKDLESGPPMNRLIQGDVGSGKTLVALLAALQVGNINLQTAFLAPTEILARQHFDTISTYLADYPHTIGLLTSNFHIINDRKVTKTEYYEALANGEITISIGTHAQLQKSVTFHKLGLIVIDEQHRFGVAQRQYLKTVSEKSIHPHLLSMSATPIPRTLALSLHGDLAISTLSQVPSGRSPVITNIVLEDGRDKVYDFIKKEVADGRQAFIVTPRVELTRTGEVRSVKKEYNRLTNLVFPQLKVGLLYGSMKGAEKDAVMTAMHDKLIDILIATSVIEIGIDIPNASVIVIEGAESFGLAQLHQLRGRVGRGKHQSYCFLFTTNPSQQDNERLQVFKSSQDGFALAQLDLKQRGFGDLFGKQQTGYAFRYRDFITLPVLEQAKKAAEGLIAKDPQLQSIPQMKMKVAEYSENLHME